MGGCASLRAGMKYWRCILIVWLLALACPNAGAAQPTNVFRVTTDGQGVQFDKNDYDPAKPGSGADLSKVDSYAGRWTAKYTGGWDLTNEGRDYFDQLLAEVRKEISFLKKRVLLVPVGHVMAALDEQMKADQVPGYRSINQF